MSITGLNAKHQTTNENDKSVLVLVHSFTPYIFYQQINDILKIKKIKNKSRSLHEVFFSKHRNLTVSMS